MIASSSPSRPAAPTAPQLAELIHATLLPTSDRPHLVGITVEPSGDVALALWEVPPTLADPVAPLVGYRAPADWSAVALSCSARRHDLAHPGATPTPITTTVVRTRDGQAATVLSAEGEPWERLSDPPAGPAADVLARVLGCPTPAAEHSSAILIDLTWLERIAASRAERSARHLTWEHLADRHPLRQTGPTPAPEALHERTSREASANPWSALLARSAQVSLPAASHGPPGGTVLTAAEWFDEGAMCRWSMRQALPVRTLLDAALAKLDAEVAAQVSAALVEAGSATAPPAP